MHEHSFSFFLLYYSQLVAWGLEPKSPTNHAWGYEPGDNVLRPEDWVVDYPGCSPKVRDQSPIDLNEAATRVVHDRPLNFKEFDDQPCKVIIENTGHSIMVTVIDKQPTLTGDRLDGVYKFIQYHFHWGPSIYSGSENEINGTPFPMEIHSVFIKEKYNSFEEAREHEGGVVVISTFLEMSVKPNKAFAPLIETLKGLTKPDSKIHKDNFVPLSNLLPKDTNEYFYYKGSLTTPPCSPAIWIQMEHPIAWAPEQMAEFHKINSHKGPMVHNFRSIQPLNGREVLFNTVHRRASVQFFYKFRKHFFRKTDAIVSYLRKLFKNRFRLQKD